MEFGRAVMAKGQSKMHEGRPSDGASGCLDNGEDDNGEPDLIIALLSE